VDHGGRADPFDTLVVLWPQVNILAQAEAMPRYNAPEAYWDPEVAAAIIAWLTAHA
jgi:hypothetical protein